MWYDKDFNDGEDDYIPKTPKNPDLSKIKNTDPGNIRFAKSANEGENKNTEEMFCKLKNIIIQKLKEERPKTTDALYTADRRKAIAGEIKGMEWVLSQISEIENII